jgi:hypothetical protein
VVTVNPKNAFRIVPICILFCLAPAAPAEAGRGPILEVEGGVVSCGYNDVRIPGVGGTRFSLVDDLETDPDLFVRMRLTYKVGERHTFSVLAAPLRLDAQGTVPAEIIFEGKTFPAETALSARYRFDSYRLTYRYGLHSSPRLKAGIGVTAKIRDAAVSIEGGDTAAEKTNTGFVPLINFSVSWTVRPGYGLLLEGDALAAPQGRAEDVLIALFYEAGERLALRIGYRLLEGGANNDEVYNFALLHYGVLGVSLAF